MTQPYDDDADMVDRTREDGQTVGAADAAEDARQAGADRDTPMRDLIQEGTLGADSDGGTASDGGVPVGEADAEADRQGAGGN